MIVAAPEQAAADAGLAPAFAATRSRLGLVAVLVALAGAGWFPAVAPTGAARVQGAGLEP